jgi:RHS repeat-associated protein
MNSIFTIYSRLVPRKLAALIASLVLLLGAVSTIGQSSGYGSGYGYGGSGYGGYSGSSTNTSDPSEPPCVPDEYTCCDNSGSGDEEEDCDGMPRWRVTEPILNLWLVDRPLWYQPSRGPRVTLDLFFKNIQGTNGAADNGTPGIFGVGTNWHTKWRAYATPVSSTEALVFRGDGSARVYTLNQVDYNTRLKLESASPGYTLTAPNGSLWRFTTETVQNGVTNWFIASREDMHGNAVQFFYSTNGNKVTLTNVVDVDGAATTFEYVSAGPYSNLISKVIAPGARTNILSYDSSGRLTNIVDMGGLSTSFAYDSTNNLRHLMTPYGTSTFSVWATATNWSALKIAEVGLRTNFWLYLDNDTLSRLPTEYSGRDPILTTTPSLPRSWDTNDSHLRNTFYWNQHRIEQLSANVRTNLLNDTFDADNVTTNDFQLARQRHWLRTAAPSTVVGRTLSFERAPTPDGVEAGQITWYDYEGKPSGTNWMEGTQFLPRCIGWKLPDASSRYTFFTRNSLGHPTLTYETYQVGGSIRSNRFEYAANGIDLTRQVRFLADASQRTVSSNVFNAGHLITSTRNALDEVTDFAYDGSNRLVTVSRPSGLFTTNVYDANGRLSQVVDRDGAAGVAFRTNAFTWTNGLVLTHTDPRGATTTNTYDAFGRVTQMSDALGAVSYSYNKLDLIKAVDRMGFVRSNLFDPLQRLVRHTDARTNTTSFTQCSCGSLDYMTNAVGEVTHFAYDFQGRLTTTFHPDGYNVTNTWNAMSELAKISDNGGTLVTNTYNQQGLLSAAETAGGRLFSRTYDIEDQLVSATDANGVTTTNRFDGLGRVFIRGLQATNSMEGFTWSARGLLRYTNQLGHVTTNGYDALGRKVGETNANNERVRFTYSPGGELLTLTDGKDQVTTWQYDLFGRVTNKADNLGTNVFVYRYDANNRLIYRWTPVKGDTGYTNDPNGNITLVNYSNSTDIVMNYDALNRLTNMVDAVGTNRYSFNTAGLLASEDGPWDSDTVSYTYTTGRQRSKLSLLQPNATAWDQTYAYDLARRLTNTASPAGLFRYEYTTTGGTTPGRLIKKLTLPSGAYMTNAFDGVARLLSTTLRNSSHSALNSHSYELNSGHQRTKQTRFDNSSVDYGYDPIGQLKTALGRESGGTTNRLYEQLGYQYDAAGNLLRRTNNALVQTFYVDSLHQLTSIDRGTNFTLAGFTTIPATNVTINGADANRYADSTFAKDNLALLDGNNTFTAVAKDNNGRSDTNALTLNLPASVTFSYDLNGNLRTNGTRTFEYDDENQLTRITEPSAWKSEFSYDGRLRRRIRKEFTWRNSSWVLTNEVHYVYDGNVVLQERNEFNVASKTFTRALDLSGTRQRAGGTGGLLAFSDHSLGPPFHVDFHADGNGNVTALVDRNQQVQARYLYDPFGNSLSANGPLADLNLYRFSSKELHQHSGLVYYAYRYYVPNLQRWGNRDPVHELNGFNLNAYLRGSDPVNWIDVDGLGPYKQHDTVKDAVKDALKDIKDSPIKVEGVVAEQSTTIFKDDEGKYYYPIPKWGTDPLNSPYDTTSDKKNPTDTPVAHCHSHPKGEKCSTKDKQNADKSKLPEYVLTPTKVIEYDPKTKEEKASDIKIPK